MRYGSGLDVVDAIPGRKERFSVRFKLERGRVVLNEITVGVTFAALPESLKGGPYEVTPEGYYLQYGAEPKVRLWQPVEGEKSEKPPSVAQQPSENSEFPAKTTGEVVELLKNRRVVFYTGAGISRGVVPTIRELNEDLGIGVGENGETDLFVRDAVNHPQILFSKIEDFIKTLYAGEPTSAHKALSTIAHAQNTPILTENLDLLHERSGLKSIKVCSPPVIRGIREGMDSHWHEIDCLLTVGLSHDASGLIKTFMDSNPRGIVIAIDRAEHHVPDYLRQYSTEGRAFLVKGDAQQILPVIAESLGLSPG